MSATTPDSNDRFPTTGPGDSSYERYHFHTTTDGKALIYDEDTDEAWIQATWCVSLEEWR